MLKHLRTRTDSLYVNINKLEDILAGAGGCRSGLEASIYYRDKVLPVMDELRSAADEIERFVGEKYWPYPTYGELLFSV